MPVLAAYFDISNVSIAIENKNREKDGEFTFTSFPYVYSGDLFSNQISQEDYYKYALEAVLKSYKLKLADYDLLVTGFLEPPKLNIETKLSVDVLQVIKSIQGIYPVFVNNCSVLTGDHMIAYVDNSKGDEANFYANLAVYPQVLPNDVTMQTALDHNLVIKAKTEKVVFDANLPIIFSGSRFSQRSTYNELDYLLMFELMKSPGIYQVRKDTKNILMLLHLIKMYRNDFVCDIDNYFESVGTYIYSEGNVECLLSSDIGTGQFFDVSKNQLYILPQDAELQVKASIKSSQLGNIEGLVKGGQLGLIFNTTDYHKPIYEDVKLLSTSIRSIGEYNSII